jgi:hypothetical protein
MMNHYDGPVLIIRRTHDEIITSAPRGNVLERLAQNRANPLLIDLLQRRYPQLFYDNYHFDDNVEFVLYLSIFTTKLRFADKFIPMKQMNL